MYSTMVFTLGMVACLAVFSFIPSTTSIHIHIHIFEMIFSMMVSLLTVLLLMHKVLLMEASFLLY